MLTITGLLLATAVAGTLAGCNSLPKSETHSPVSEVPKASWSDPSTFFPLVHATEVSQVVQLGESIHLTREMPLVRIGALKALNERGRFDILAIEGSAVDSWLAMDRLLREPLTLESLREAQREAFFGLWQTDEMLAVLEVVAQSLKTNHPIYVTSFDGQVGMSVAWRKKAIFEHLADALRNYGLQESRVKVIQALKPLENAKLCFQSGFPKTDHDEKAADKAIARLEKWIETIEPRVEKTSAFHARALALLPLNLRNNLALCKAKTLAHQQNPWRVYQETRDKLNTENVMAIVDRVSSSGKVITWAHHSHVHHNSQGKSIPSMGQHLRERLGEKLYTVGLFALAGEALMGQEEPTLQKLKEGPELELASVFRSLSVSDYYLDLRAPSTKAPRFEAFFRPSTVQMENIIHPVVLARDFDGVIVLQKVSAPVLRF